MRTTTTNVQVAYDEEKLDALKVFLEEKEKTLDGELTVMMDALYERIVPQKVQLFIEKKNRTDSGKQKPKSECKPL